MQKNYKGLSNIGATCYMNSLLQTLFMTPQFRYSIYKWKYNQKIHPKQVDSILFQLQKLFGKLETDFPAQLTTKDLVKSFQWEDQEAHMQQDIQQFNRLLFEALQKSITLKSQKYIPQNFVKDFFEGELINYTKCHECLTQSVREQNFQDLMINVKNVYQKVYNGSLALGIQRYLKPQVLDQNNLYDCSYCNKKTRAQRGTRFIRMPKLLNVILERFTFNYFTMQRQKINDSVEFPFILNFNHYIQGYEHIPHKLNQDSSQYFKNNFNEGPKAKTTRLIQKKTLNPPLKRKTNVPSIAGKTTTKPSVNTKSFLAQMRKNKNLQKQSEDLFYVSGSNTVISDLQIAKIQSLHEAQLQSKKTSLSNSVKSQQLQVISMQDENMNSIADNINQSTRQIISPTNNGSSHLNGIQKKQLCKSSTQILLPPPLQIIPQDLSSPYLQPVACSVPQTLQKQLQQKLLNQKKQQTQKQHKLLLLQEQNKNKIQQFLKDGPLVYQLFAVMVHNGTANHGHYFSYIQSFENHKWYCFNDSRVDQINVDQIKKTFGHINSNAYALYYRMADSHQQQNYIDSIKQDIPDYIKDLLNNQRQMLTQKEKNKFQNLQNIVILKIYHQLYVKQLQMLKSNSLQLAVQKSMCLFNIPIQQRQNVRLRMFNPVSQSKLQTYGNRQHLSLQQLKIGSYRSLLLEVKKTTDQFQQYQVGSIWLRIALLQQNLNLDSLDQINLKLHKISIKRFASLKQILSVIKKKRTQILINTTKQIRDQQICLIKRHQNNDETIHQIISISENSSKNIDDLTILQNQILFVEVQSEQLKWPIQFQNQQFRISIKYNNPPGTCTFQTYLTDSRITIQQLKNELCVFLQLNPEDLMMKMGTKSGRQLKDTSITLKQARFITGTQVYFDFGIPAKTGQIRIQLFLSTDADINAYDRLHQFQYLTDVPILGTLKASQVKQKFLKIFKKIKGIDLKLQQFRIRERVSGKIGKIYRERPMKEQQLIQRRQIAIELKPDQNLDIKQFSIYVRLWDQQNWQLSKKIQIVVSKSTTMVQFYETITGHTQNILFPAQTQLSICRILSIHKFNLVDLTAMQWFDVSQDVAVIGQPMFVNADGLLYVVKKTNQFPRELTKDEQSKFGGSIKPYNMRDGTNKASYKPKQAKGMKIKVIQKDQEMEQEEQENNIHIQK